MKRKPKTLWILGAGFSRALGGPLIEDLLTDRGKHPATLGRSLDPLRAQNLDLKVSQARRFFGYGKGIGLWDHAEQFLDTVESAHRDGKPPALHASATLSNLLGKKISVEPDRSPIEIGDIEKLREYARLALVADCCLFLRGADTRTERWQPYVDWAKKLDSSNTVVTFNYDRVPELLAEQQGANLKVIVPLNNINEDIDNARARGLAPVLKVHGSVDWLRSGGTILVDDNEAALQNPTNVLIGVPGPAKRELVKGDVQSPLALLWTRMKQEIKEADQIFFVGYRFPPTDADARNDCLGSIRKNTGLHHTFEMRTVLGSDINSRDSARLLALLRACAPTNRKYRAKIEALPFFAEDFLSLYGAGVGMTQ